MAKRVVFDFETTGLDPWKGARVFLSGTETEEGEVVMAEPGTKAWTQQMAVLGDKSVDKVGWNVKFDLKMARETGIPVRGRVHDAMLLTYMNNEYEPNLKLKECGQRHLQIPADEEKEVKRIIAGLKRRGKKDANYSHVPRPIMRKYLEKDLDLTMRMLWKMEGVMAGPQKRVYEIEREVIGNAVDIERWGIHIDKDYCKKAIVQNKVRIAELYENLYAMVGCKFNPNSRGQLETAMLSLGMDTGVRSKDGIMATGADHMHQFVSNPFVEQLMELRSLNKITGTYFEAFLDKEVDSIIHPNFWPFGEDEGIKTGRFSSSDPNFQNIPGGGRGKNTEMLRDPGLVRRAVKPRPGYVFLFSDYDQIEFKLFACAAGAERLLHAIRKGVDFHVAAGWYIFGRDCFDGLSEMESKKLRFQSKELNFSLIFGMGTKRYAHRAGITLRTAQERKNQYFSNVPEARDFMLMSQADLLRDGYVQDQFGRRYHVPRELAYKAANALCQGPAALINKRGINRVFDRLKGLDAHPFITVHDETGVEVRRDQVYDAKVALQEGMEDRDNFPVPITTSVSVAETSWAEKIKWEKVESKWKTKSSVSVRR